MPETFRSEYVRCGKAACRSCPHGPYWYAYRREAGKVKKRYCGRVDPRPEDRQAEPYHRHDAIFDRATASARLAAEIMGVVLPCGPLALTERYRQLMRIHHPDRGGDHVISARINAAYSYLRR